eukprot:3360231-Pleurochrysis_carterae.AAC.1
MASRPEMRSSPSCSMMVATPGTAMLTAGSEAERLSAMSPLPPVSARTIALVPSGPRAPTTSSTTSLLRQSTKSDDGGGGGGAGGGGATHVLLVSEATARFSTPSSMPLIGPPKTPLIALGMEAANESVSSSNALSSSVSTPSSSPPPRASTAIPSSEVCSSSDLTPTADGRSVRARQPGCSALSASREARAVRFTPTRSVASSVVA